MALAMTRPLTWARDASGLSLEDLLDEARASYQEEILIPMAVEQPPLLSWVGADGSRAVDWDRLAAQIGWTMSAQLTRRIGHPEGFGNVFPVARAIHDLEGWCRGRHLEGRDGPWEDHTAAAGLWGRLAGARPLCARLAFYTVTAGVPLGRLVIAERLPLPTIRRLLKDALEHMWAQRREWAFAPDSGVGEVLADQRRQRREERRARREAEERAQASRAPGVVCRHCARPYDPDSQDPCPGSDGVASIDVEVLASVGFTLLCSPA